jgi:hypothetical protein
MSHKIKAIGCVLDWSLWPRYEAQELDATNLKRIKVALEAGVILPPIIVNKDDMRVIDGFHRVTAVLDLYGDDAEIEADVRHYETEAEMFLDAGRYNSQHGLPMGPRDKVHFILKARRMKIPAPAIAEALGMQASMMKDFVERRSAVAVGGERIPLTGGALHLAGKQLDEEQEHYVRTTNGNAPMMHARMLLNALRADAMEFAEKDVKLLKELGEQIRMTLKEV